jgi:hypothetical protein
MLAVLCEAGQLFQRFGIINQSSLFEIPYPLVIMKKCNHGSFFLMAVYSLLINQSFCRLDETGFLMARYGRTFANQ